MRKTSRRKKSNEQKQNISDTNELEVPVQAPDDPPVKKYETIIRTINWDSLNTKRKLDSDLRDAVIEVYDSMKKDPGDCIDRLNSLIEEYHDIQLFYNYLENCYRLEGKSELATEMAQKTAKKFPSYLFGKISQAELYLENKELDKIESLFENKFNYEELYPEKGTFHIVEVLSFACLLGKYYTLKGDLEKANEQLNIIKNMDEDHPYYKFLKKYIDKNSGVKFYQKVLKKLKG